MGLMADILNERKLVVKSGREEARMKQEARSNRMENQSGAIASYKLLSPGSLLDVDRPVAGGGPCEGG